MEGNNSTLTAYQIPVGNKIWSVQIPGFVEAFALSPDNRILACVSNRRKRVQLRSLVDGHLIDVIPLPGDHIINNVAFSPNGQVLGIAAGNRVVGETSNIALWNLKTRKVMRILRGFRLKSLGVFAVAISRDGLRVAGAVNSAEDNLSELLVWNSESGRVVFRRFTDKADGVIMDLTFSPDGRLIVSGGDRNVLLRDATNGKVSKRLGKADSGFWKPSYSLDGRLITAVASYSDRECGLWMWDSRSLHLIKKQKLSTVSPEVSVSKTGNYLAYSRKSVVYFLSFKNRR
jgi:WD40 repeat protein